MRLFFLHLRRVAPMLALACAGLSTASYALPDLARGLAAVQRGDAAAAEADLLPLAEQGYLQAQTALGRLYAAQGTPESTAKAVRMLRAAAKNDPSLRVPLARTLLRAGAAADVAEIERLLKGAAGDNDAAAPALQLRLYREFPHLIDPARADQLAQRVSTSERVEDRTEAIAWYRANSPQPAQAQALARLCEKDRGVIEECYVDLARHFRAVNDAGALATLNKEALERFEQKRLSPDTLERIARSLSADDLPGTPSPAVAYAMLGKIKEPSPAVVARKARLLMADPNLDPQADAVALLKAAHAQGSVEAALYLGRLYFDDRNPVADPLQAERLLAEAAPTLPAAHIYLGRMFERGVNGQMDARRALTHYLLAARAGEPIADLALARMYWNNRGVKVDPVYAYAFTRLAVHQGLPGAAEFLATLRPSLTATDVANGEQLAKREFAARMAAAGPAVGAPLTTAEAKAP